MNMKKIFEEMQKKMFSAQPPVEIEEDSGESIEGLVAKIPEMEKQVEQLRAMKGMPGIDNALKMLEGQLNQLKAVAKMQSDPVAAAKMSSQAAAEIEEAAVEAVNNLSGLSMAAPKPATPKAASDPRFPMNGNTGKRVEYPIPQDSGEQITGGPLIKWVDGNHVEFGSYPQDADGGVRKILWRVLENKDGKLLMISEFVLDLRDWHFRRTEDLLPASTRQKEWKQEDILASIVSWENSKTRYWLNNEFYNRAFHAAERKIINERLNTGNGAYMHRDYKPVRGKDVNVNVLGDDTYETYEERGCRDTKDRVFLLNVDEAIRYFGKSFIFPQTAHIMNADRAAKPTEFILKRGFIHEGFGLWYATVTSQGFTWLGKEKLYYGDEYSGTLGYWLRNIGSNDLALTNAVFHKSQTAMITENGAICAGGSSSTAAGVRPVILINNP